MLIPLGILAGSGGVEGDYELIATEILTSSQSSVTFSDLGDYSSTYKHLQVRFSARTTETSFNRSDLIVRINGDSSTNYDSHYLFATGSTGNVSSGSDVSSSWIYAGSITSNFDTSGSFGVGIFDLLDAYSTTKNKTGRSLAGRMGGSFPYIIALNSGHWRSTSSVTSLTFSILDAENLVAGSRFSIYGLKG
jgi:hypothetical protein